MPDPALTERGPVLEFSLMFTNQKGEVWGELQFEIRVEERALKSGFKFAHQIGDRQEVGGQAARA